MKMLKAGTIVKLKSGGPHMTVQGHDMGGRVICDWFAGLEKKQGHFNEAQVEIVA